MSNTDPDQHISPPLPHHPKPRSAVPSYLLNGHSPLSQSSNSAQSTVTRPEERDKLASSIRATYGRGNPISIEPTTVNVYDNTRYEDGAEGQEDSVVNMKSESLGNTPGDTSTPQLWKEQRNGTHVSPPTGASRPQSPYTLAPPIDFDGLSWPCIGTRARLEQTPEQAQERLNKLSGAVRTILECIGEDPDREGLLGTPERYAKALMFFTKGYEENVRDLVNGAVFAEDHDELVIVKDIDIFSLCEHHMVPFMGKMHIGYIPNQKVLGLSKLARLAEMFSRRLQIQERLTKQVALAISEVLKPQGVGIVVESSHLCMVGRGVQATNSSTTTSCMLGAMRRSSKTREEFLSLLNRK